MKTLDDLLAEGVAGRTVLVRPDLDVPLDIGPESSHISTGGGASPEYREGEELPGIAVLEGA